MKVTALSVSAIALAPVVLAKKPAEHENRQCKTFYALGTTTNTVTPTTTQYTTTKVHETLTVDVFTKVKKTITLTVPTTFSSTLFFTVTSTSTSTAPARTVSPPPVTSTIATPAGFTPAVSALGTASAGANAKRDAAPEALKKEQKKDCTNTVMDEKTIYITGTNTFTATVTISRPAKHTSTVTNTITLPKGKPDYRTVFNTITSVVHKVTTTTSTTSVTPTVTLVPQTVSFYAACAASNLLDYTLSSGAPSNGTADGSNNDDGSYYTRHKKTTSTTTTTHKKKKGSKKGGSGSKKDESSYPKIKLARRSTPQQVGINGVSNTGDLSVRENGAASAYACCVACQTATDCAGSAYSAESGCSLYTSTTCANGQGQAAGTFTYDSGDQLASGEGEVVSNGPCGSWVAGGNTAGQ